MILDDRAKAPKSWRSARWRLAWEGSPTVAAVAGDDSVAAGRDANVSADRGSVAAEVIHGIGMYVEAPRPEAARLPVSLPPRPLALAGREDLLADLHGLLAADNEPTPQVVALCGLGGVGKTSLAAEYAHRHLAELGIAWQVQAEDPVVAAAGIAELAAQAGGRGAADPRDPVASAHAILAAWPGQWLLIFDNAPDEGSVRRFLPPAGRGRVLITSQSQHWPGAHVVDVPVLDLAVAARFLKSRAGDPDQEAAVDLAAELGGLPLALAQAAAYAQATGITLASYLGMFRQRQAELLVRGEAPGHPATVAATLGLALARLDADAPAAGGLARLLAFLAPEPAPLTLLLANQEAVDVELDADVAAVLGPLLGDQLAVGDAVAALRRYSLVTPAGDGMVLAHRLVQAVTREQVPVEQARMWQRAAAALTEAAIPADPSLPDGWPACAALLPHAQAVLGLTSSGMWKIARYIGDSGSYRAARDMFARIAAAHELEVSYGPEHRDTLVARYTLAVLAGKAGDAAEARELLAALLPDVVRVLGPDHPDTLVTRNNLASWTGEVGDPAGARDQLAALLPDKERVLGPDHPSTLTTRHVLASWTGEAGDPAGARDQLAALLPDVVRVLGPDHPNTLTTRYELTRWTGLAGDPAGARDQLAALLPDVVRVLGPDHPSTLTTRRSIEYWTSEAAPTG